MRLVIDTGILISAILKDSATRGILLESVKKIKIWKTSELMGYFKKRG